MNSVYLLLLLYLWYSGIIPSDCVLYPPSLIQQPEKDETYRDQEALKLRCVATGNPTPTYEWTKNNLAFNIFINTGRYTRWPNEGTLIFALPSGDDDGIYQCIASNERGKAFSVKSNVRRAEIQNFKRKDLETITVHQGQYLKLTCEVPVSYPVPIVAWEKTTKNNNNPDLLKDSSKYVTDIDGNLYITGVTMDDNQAMFMCTVYNNIMRVTKKDHPIVLTVIESQSRAPVTTLFRTLQPIIGVVGKTVILRCILGGNPPPVYKWTVKGQTKDILERPNFSTDAGGAILIINPVTETDQDTYQCTGENTATAKPVVNDFAVDVLVMPYLTMKLSDHNVPYNGSVQFKCEARGTPPPIIVWTVNGLGLDTYLNGKNKKQIENTIILTNLMPGDQAVFQCNASNSIGYDFSNGYINVLKDKPEFILGPQTTLVKSENNDVTINCQAFSAPKAIVSWMKDGFPINGGRYVTQDNGDMLIKKLITGDSGVYSCTATNLYGSINGSSSLFVRQRTELMIRPINTWVYEGNEVKFVCTAKTDRLENHNLKIIWYKDGSEVMLGDNGRINTNLQDNSLIISGAMTTDTGVYTCNATNGLDSDVAYASLMVQSKPFTPIRITADCSQYSDQSQALVKWIPGADNYAPIISYLVEYSTQYDRKAWYEVQRVTPSTEGTGDTVDVKVSMKPHINYRFRLRAINRVGMSEPSDPTTDDCFLPPNIPFSNPKELYLYGTTKDNLIIQWTPMTYVEHNGPKLGYEISVMCLTCKSIPQNVTNTTYISDWDQNIITYYNFQIGANAYEMESFQYFKASIISRNEMGFSKQPHTVAYGYSGDGPPAIEAKNLVMTPGTPAKGYIPLTWNVIPKAEIGQVNGFFRGYRIEWCLSGLSDIDCDASTQYQDVILQSQTLPVLFGNLRRKRSAETFYGEKEQLLNFDTKYRQVIPANPITSINFQVLQRRKRAILNNPQDWDYGKNLTVQLTMVPGNTPIKIWLRVLSSLYASSRSDPPITITTFEDTPGPVIDFKVSLLSINHVVLQWLKPIETNGVITGYRLAWREILGLELGYMTTYPDVTNPNQLQFQMSGLKAQTRYRVLIWALTSQGAGIESFLDIETQPAYIAPNAPKFTVTGVVNNTANLTFAPSDIGVKGSVFYAQYRKAGQYRWDESEPQYIRMWIFIGNLANDTTYEIRVVATNGAGMATPSVIATFHTRGRLDPTRPVRSNAIWIVVVVLILIFLILLIVFMLWYRDRTMDRMMGKPDKTSNMYSQPKIYDSVKQPLYPPSQMSTSLLSDPINTQQRVQSPVNGSLIDSYESPPISGALIDDDDHLPPVAFNQQPRIKKHKSKKPKPQPEHNNDDNDDTII